MGDHEHSTIKHQDHVLLDQPLLRLPYELLRNNFRAAHFTVEKDSSTVKSLLRETATAAVNGKAAPDQVLKNLDTMIAKMRGVKRKLTSYADEEARLHHQSAARVAHLGELYAMHGYDDVKYETWSRKRLDRLLVDYLLRSGHADSARALTAERGMDDLVDVQTFEQMNQIQQALLGGSVTEALAWCQDNKKELRKMDSKLEVMLRFQQYIELLRGRTQNQTVEAINHARKYLIGSKGFSEAELRKAAGMLAYRPDAAPAAYTELYSPEKWHDLADLFTATHAQLLSLPSFPLLHIALSSGLSALKTPACHSSNTASSIAAAAAAASTAGPSSRHHASSASSTEMRPAMTDPAAACPICSTELNDLARNVPYAHHTQSHVDTDLLLLPNNIAYGRDRLEAYAEKSGLDPTVRVRDLRTGAEYATKELEKVYIT
ncbi:fyv-10 [Plectosphaerella plurivora]|uniref:Fyv-10 n=1 Tax=Plectosphaerella plurivora TaxID=936078 RepID=A0A9P8V4D3_9PEZI|nr:fyv-10 [Plectosphaerella plurivora]